MHQFNAFFSTNLKPWAWLALSVQLVILSMLASGHFLHDGSLRAAGLGRKRFRSQASSSAERYGRHIQADITVDSDASDNDLDVVRKHRDDAFCPETCTYHLFAG